MKLQKILLILLILFASFQFCFGQEKSKAELIDEFGNITCEDLIARQDNLIALLQNDSTAVGYVVIYGKKDDLRGSWRNKRFIDGQTESRRFDEQRIIVVRGKESEDLRIQFWKIPTGAEKPDFEESNWSFTLFAKRKPFIFSSTGWEEGPCPIGLQLKTYSDYLIANSNINGNIVIFANSKTEFQNEKEKLSNKLTNNYEISPNRLRFFYEKIKGDYPYTELWLVPQKKK